MIGLHITVTISNNNQQLNQSNLTNLEIKHIKKKGEKVQRYQQKNIALAQVTSSIGDDAFLSAAPNSASNSIDAFFLQLLVVYYLLLLVVFY